MLTVLGITVCMVKSKLMEKGASLTSQCFLYILAGYKQLHEDTTLDKSGSRVPGGFGLKVTTVRGKAVWGLKEHRAGKHTHHNKFFISAIFGP